MVRSSKSIGVILLVVLLTGPVQGSEWGNWRGPNFNGSTDEKNLPASWSWEKDVVWKSSLPGPSGATPIICNGRVYVSSMVGKSGDFVALCIDARNGNRLWQRKTGSDSRKFPRNNMASPSPVTDGKLAIFLYGSGHLVGFDVEGNPLWSRNIEKEYGNLAIKFGYGSSPLLVRNKLIIPVIRRDHPYRPPEAAQRLDSYLLALNPKTGKTIWKQPRPTNTFDESMETYGTPLPFVRNERMEILNSGADFITANDPETGKELWRFEYHKYKVRDTRIIPSLVTGADLIFGTRHKSRGAFALDPSDRKRIVWEYTGPATDCPTPLFYQGRLYVLDGMKHGKVVSCLEPKSGNVIWQGKIGGRSPWRASLTGADDKLYCVNEDGEIVVLAAGGREFNILFRTKIDEGPMQSTIAVANSCLFLRTAKNLYCIVKPD
jgi:outer membrane protein assembly factor BamB